MTLLDCGMQRSYDDGLVIQTTKIKLNNKEFIHVFLQNRSWDVKEALTTAYLLDNYYEIANI
jgi:hypothetical protein